MGAGQAGGCFPPPHTSFAHRTVPCVPASSRPLQPCWRQVRARTRAAPRIPQHTRTAFRSLRARGWRGGVVWGGGLHVAGGPAGSPPPPADGRPCCGGPGKPPCATTAARASLRTHRAVSCAAVWSLMGWPRGAAGSASVRHSTRVHVDVWRVPVVATDPPPRLFPHAAASALPNIIQLAQSVPELSTLVTAVTAGGLVSTLEGPG